MRVGLLYRGDETGWVWGSSMTTRGLSHAFASLGASVWRASIDVLTDWRQLSERQTDLLVLEGVSRSRVPTEVWESSVVKVHWWLSHLNHDLEELPTVGYDAVATNSHTGYEWLRSRMPSALVELAASEEHLGAKPIDALRDAAVYVGSYPHKSNDQMKRFFLAPLVAERLQIFGSGWSQSPYAAHARGVLPQDQLGAIYAGSLLCLGLTERRQMASGMINNRVFEALATGAHLIAEPFPALVDHSLGRFIHFATDEVEATRAVRKICDIRSCHDTRVAELKPIVEAEHTYRSRALTLIRLYSSLIRNQ
jgi:hypothetical protein